MDPAGTPREPEEQDRPDEAHEPSRALSRRTFVTASAVGAAAIGSVAFAGPASAATPAARAAGAARTAATAGAAATGATTGATAAAAAGPAHTTTASGAASQPDGWGHRPGGHASGAAIVYANNVGYDTHGPKRFVVGTEDEHLPDTSFHLIDAATGRRVHSGRLTRNRDIKDWQAQHYPDLSRYFWTADFSQVTTTGIYVLQVGDYGPSGLAEPTGSAGRALPLGISEPFRIEDYVLERRTLSHVIHYFKGSRDSGQYAKQDSHLPMGSGSTSYLDAHGGWYDAAGDYGIHFAQVMSPYLSTTQVPLTAWTCLASARQLGARTDPALVVDGVPGTDLTALQTWMVDEGLFGADFLVRMRIPDGPFYSGIAQPGVAKDPTQRFLSTRPVGYRGGAGEAIAALALASTLPVSDDFSSADYLAAATGAYTYLAAHNVDLNSDHTENLIDEYDALLAAVELFRATKDSRYHADADRRAAQISARLGSWRRYHDYWRVAGDERPFVSPSNSGLPVVALLAYTEIADAATAKRVRQVVRRSLEFEMAVTQEVPNPFGYARELVQNKAGARYSSYFMPQDIGGPEHSLNKIWWQGENARIGSLATAARLASRAFAAEDPRFATALEGYARDQLNWILGVNPFALCMLGGSGRNNPEYIYIGSWRYQPQAGGIVNGITSKTTDGLGIEWNLDFTVLGEDSDWRWKEQWLPHSAWYMYAVSVGAAAR